MNLINFSNCEEDFELFGGRAGAKISVLYNKEKWILKFGKTTKSMKNVNISYTNSPVCEYVGSQIYSLLGLPVHETKLGVYNAYSQSTNKYREYFVVACKNFKENEGDKFYPISDALNKFNAENNNIDNDTLDLETVLSLLKNNLVVDSNEIIKRFWQMFVVDALINNNDRHLGNFGVIENNGVYTIAPIYDNGASFYNKIDDEKAKDILSDESRKLQSFYHSRISVYTMNGIDINPYKYIESMSNEDCNKAILDIYPRINMELVDKIIDEVPNEVLSYNIKELFKESFKYGVVNVLKPVYDKLINQK